jgi:ectoine hydroxylase-related dioxygenase (phytanoyl-CoA dioxygenase family)
MVADIQPHETLDSPYPLSPEHIGQYQRDGHILLRGLASEREIEIVRPSIRKVLEEVAAAKDTQGRIEDYSSLFTQVTNVWRLNERGRRFVFAKRFARVAAELMGVTGVRLYHDQALFKPAGGNATPWHQDQVYWPLDTVHTITLWMPLVNLTTDMGTMLFAAGSHQGGPLASLAISEESNRFIEDLIRGRGYPVATYDLNAGDATFHAGWTAHAAHANSSDRVREVMTVIYYADGTRLMHPDNEFRKVDMEVFHPGQKPGELAASELNPLLYSAEGIESLSD